MSIDSNLKFFISFVFFMGFEFFQKYGIKIVFMSIDLLIPNTLWLFLSASFTK